MSKQYNLFLKLNKEHWSYKVATLSPQIYQMHHLATGEKTCKPLCLSVPLEYTTHFLKKMTESNTALKALD